MKCSLKTYGQTSSLSDSGQGVQAKISLLIAEHGVQRVKQAIDLEIAMREKAIAESREKFRLSKELQPQPTTVKVGVINLMDDHFNESPLTSKSYHTEAP